MSWRIGLMVLQGIGAITLVPYPAILVANVMQMAAEGPKGWERFVSALPFLLLSLYPLVWAGLYFWSWRLMARGGTGWAYFVSTIPLLLSAIGVALFFGTGNPGKSTAASSPSGIEQAANPKNPR